MTLTTKRKPIVGCDYCLRGKTTRIILTRDNEKLACCKECYSELGYYWND